MLGSNRAFLCRVCGDRASGRHYGAPSCDDCRGFFKRSVKRNLRYTCNGNNRCVVDALTRNQCQACRFAKCLSVNMSKRAVHNERAPGGGFPGAHLANLQLPWQERPGILALPMPLSQDMVREIMEMEPQLAGIGIMQLPLPQARGGNRQWPPQMAGFGNRQLPLPQARGGNMQLPLPQARGGNRQWPPQLAGFGNRQLPLPQARGGNGQWNPHHGRGGNRQLPRQMMHQQPQPSIQWMSPAFYVQRGQRPPQHSWEALMAQQEALVFQERSAFSEFFSRHHYAPSSHMQRYPYFRPHGAQSPSFEAFLLQDETFIPVHVQMVNPFNVNRRYGYHYRARASHNSGERGQGIHRLHERDVACRLALLSLAEYGWQRPLPQEDRELEKAYNELEALLKRVVHLNVDPFEFSLLRAILMLEPGQRIVGDQAHFYETVGCGAAQVRVTTALIKHCEDKPDRIASLIPLLVSFTYVATNPLLFQMLIEVSHNIPSDGEAVNRSVSAARERGL